MYACSEATDFFKKRFYLFLERGEGREKGREIINVWLPLTGP